MYHIKSADSSPWNRESKLIAFAMEGFSPVSACWFREKEFWCVCRISGWSRIFFFFYCLTFLNYILWMMNDCGSMYNCSALAEACLLLCVSKLFFSLNSCVFDVMTRKKPEDSVLSCYSSSLTPRLYLFNVKRKPTFMLYHHCSPSVSY